MTRPSTLLVLSLLAIAAPAAAQTRPVINAGRSYTVAADHDGTDVAGTGAGYRLYLCPGVVTDCATQLVQVPASARSASNVVTFPNLAGLARGTYSLFASAFNVDGEGAKTSGLVFDVRLPAPAPPTNLRLMAIQTTADGRQQLKLLELDELRQVLQLPTIAALDAPPIEPLESRSIPELLAAR
jgi:hypothetical protein